MNWSAGRMAACLALGAALMYAAANLRVRVDLAESPEAAAQPAPARLPEGFATLPLPPAPRGGIQLAGGLQPAEPKAAATLDAPTISTPVLADTKKKISKADDLSKPGIDVYRANATLFATISVTPPKDAKVLALEANGSVKKAATDGKAVEFTNIELGANGLHTIRAYAENDAVKQGAIAQIQVYVRTKGPSVEGVSSFGFGSGRPVDPVVLQLSSNSQLDKSTLGASSNYVINGLNSVTQPRQAGVEYDSLADQLTVHVTDVKPGSYQFVLPRTGTIRDLFGNPLEPSTNAPSDSYFSTTLNTQLVEQLPLPTPGVALQHGPYVPMYEYQTRPPSPAGFNPADKVDTRVVRLYYYRDAHRVAMIVNRSVKSYAAASVDIRQRSAERARDDADKHTIERKRLQMIAFRTAQEARAAEVELKNAQSTAETGSAENAKATAQLASREKELAAAQAQVDANPGNKTFAAARDAIAADVTKLRAIAFAAGAAASNANASLSRLQLRVQNLRDDEVKATEAWQVKELEETRLRSEEFRRDVAAATADPVTYAPGKPDSHDPVQQVSLSVIGEGLIQLRGPMKGINIIRVMVNQIDAPVGQVRIAVHTVQVNGERGNRMEKVVANIQRYIDHSRFLTATSAQMLKNAVTTVAARHAEQVAAELGANCTQEARDRKYLHAFFGKDFIDELVLLDSEFLKTGNKLLSLHSMNSTSLSATLFLLALAKNDIRREILAEFQAQLQGELPNSEFNYYLAGLTPEKCEACCDKKHYMLAYNAKFQSLMGFFTGEVAGNDTMTPLQREFIKLAQIFKAHLVTEITLKQRVLERALVEERIGGDYRDELRKAKEAEDLAKRELTTIQGALIDAASNCTTSVFDLVTAVEKIEGEFAESVAIFDAIQKSWDNRNPAFTSVAGATKNYAIPPAQKENVPLPLLRPVFPIFDLTPAFKSVQFEVVWIDLTPDLQTKLEQLEREFDKFVYRNEEAKKRYDRMKEILAAVKARTEKRLFRNEWNELQAGSKSLLELIRVDAARAKAQLKLITGLLGGDAPDPSKASALYRDFRDEQLAKLNPSQPYREKVKAVLDRADPSFLLLAKSVAGYQAAIQKAKLLRRPLDEKKLLDLLVDDTEDKFIEQLEGTRAHTANVDNYIKALTTALDDDFNTQFYQPAFRKVREASRLWDVTLGQIETTSVLTNNRAYAKVSPAATMEFDLPKREIMLTEGFRSAKALFDEYGALMNDPSFLALAGLYSGVPTTGAFNTGGRMSAVRNVIPGLPGSPDESIMAQDGPGRKEFGAALEALIPDPAIYKFETGTGYEVRPVLAPDGQAVVFNFQYLYTTDVREPVRADEKHLGRVKRHYVNTDVQLSNFELREVSKYMVALKAARTAKGVPLLQDVPGLGILFRPLPSAESSLQENLIYSQATIFPTLFDLMGLRYAQSIADLDPLATRMAEFAARNRELDLMQRTAMIGATRVDDAVRTPDGERRTDIYFPPVTIPHLHPNGHVGGRLNQKDSSLIEGPLYPYDVRQAYPDTKYSPYQSWPSATKPLPPEAYLPPNMGSPAAPSAPTTGGLRPGETIVPGTTRIIPGPPPMGVPLGVPRPLTPGVPPPK